MGTEKARTKFSEGLAAARVGDSRKAIEIFRSLKETYPEAAWLDQYIRFVHDAQRNEEGSD